MPNDLPENDNPWTEIPLSDYEAHMSHPSVGQLNLLSVLTQKYLAHYQPEACLFMGVAGGNGLEHVDSRLTKKVIATDINPAYLSTCFRRYWQQVPGLVVQAVDLAQQTGTVERVNLLWAALIVEYIGIDNCLAFSKNNLWPGGHLIVTIQINNAAQSVSPTGIESIKKAGTIFSPVNEQLLTARATAAGFSLTHDEKNLLPNGKSFLTLDFLYRGT